VKFVPALLVKVSKDVKLQPVHQPTPTTLANTYQNYCALLRSPVEEGLVSLNAPYFLAVKIMNLKLMMIPFRLHPVSAHPPQNEKTARKIPLRAS
jgi:hypothetical protein